MKNATNWGTAHIHTKPNRVGACWWYIPFYPKYGCLKPLPSGKLTVCYWKLPFSSLMFPLNMVIFHDFLELCRQITRRHSNATILFQSMIIQENLGWALCASCHDRAKQETQVCDAKKSWSSREDPGMTGIMNCNGQAPHNIKWGFPENVPKSRIFKGTPKKEVGFCWPLHFPNPSVKLKHLDPKPALRFHHPSWSRLRFQKPKIARWALVNYSVMFNSQFFCDVLAHFWYFGNCRFRVVWDSHPWWIKNLWKRQKKWRGNPFNHWSPKSSRSDSRGLIGFYGPLMALRKTVPASWLRHPSKRYILPDIRLITIISFPCDHLSERGKGQKRSSKPSTNLDLA
jgi:hypothetical protein